MLDHKANKHAQLQQLWSVRARFGFALRTTRPGEVPQYPSAKDWSERMLKTEQAKEFACRVLGPDATNTEIQVCVQRVLEKVFNGRRPIVGKRAISNFDILILAANRDLRSGLVLA